MVVDRLQRVHISPGFIYFCEELHHLNEGSNSRASFGGNFVAGRKNSMCVCDMCMMCVMCVYDVHV